MRPLSAIFTARIILARHFTWTEKPVLLFCFSSRLMVFHFYHWVTLNRPSCVTLRRVRRMSLQAEARSRPKESPHMIQQERGQILFHRRILLQNPTTRAPDGLDAWNNGYCLRHLIAGYILLQYLLFALELPENLSSFLYRCGLCV